MIDMTAQMKSAARAYATDLKQRGFVNVSVYRFDVPMDNREPFYRNHRTTFGYAVRYTSSPAIDAEVARGTRAATRNPIPKFHDRSVTLFIDPEHDEVLRSALTNHGGILADFAGEEVTPMYTAAWSPVTGENAPIIPTVIMKRFPKREDDQSYPWQVGPQRMFHVLMYPLHRDDTAENPKVV